jgi:hypothetical protein
VRRLRCTLLCEDREQEKFFRRVLERRFGGPIYVRRGGGVAFVRKELASNVLIVRRYHQEARGLVVAIDGDAFGREQRIRDLNDVLAKAGQKTLEGTEKIAVCVPTRTIETWEIWLCDRSAVDETTDYKKQVRPDHAKLAASAWFVQGSQADQAAEQTRLPSLAHARAEIDRLAQLGEG